MTSSNNPVSEESEWGRGRITNEVVLSLCKWSDPQKDACLQNSKHVQTIRHYTIEHGQERKMQSSGWRALRL